MVKGLLRRLTGRNSQSCSTCLGCSSTRDWRIFYEKKRHTYSYSADSVTQNCSIASTSITSLDTISEVADATADAVGEELVLSNGNIRPNITQLLHSTNYSKLRTAFLAHARKYSYEENILFMLDYERFRKLRFRQYNEDMISEDLVLNQAQGLVDKYVLDGSEYQVNIGQDLALEVIKQLTKSDLVATTAAFARISDHLSSILEQFLFESFISTYYGDCTSTEYSSEGTTSGHGRKKPLFRTPSLPSVRWTQRKSQLLGQSTSTPEIK